MSLSWQHCTHFYYSPLSLCLTAAAHVTHLSTRTHTYRNIWTTANQRGGPPFTISDWFRPRYKPNGGVFCWTTVSESRILFFSFLEWLDAPVRPGIFVSRTREKLGRTCDQIGRTLEPWNVSLDRSPFLAILTIFGLFKEIIHACVSVGLVITGHFQT